MKYLPKSKKGRVFLATFLSSVSYYTFDYIESGKVKKEIQEKLKEYGLKVIQPQDQIDKIKVFIAPSYYAMNWFDTYYRPFLYIGGMDYDVEQKELNSDLLVLVSKVLRDSRDKWSFQEEKIRNRSWIEYFLRKKVPTEKILKVNREFKGIVAIGPEVYEQVKIGYDHGLKCLKNECDQECFTINSDLGVIGEEKNYPRLLMMPGKEQTGWRGFPKRIFWAFHQRWILQETGNELLRLFKEIEEIS
jgi:hypothetical protein